MGREGRRPVRWALIFAVLVALGLGADMLLDVASVSRPGETSRPLVPDSPRNRASDAADGAHDALRTTPGSIPTTLTTVDTTPPHHVIKGRVVDASDRGIPGATVRLLTFGVDGQPGHWTVLPVHNELAARNVDLTNLPETTCDADGEWVLALPPSHASIDHGAFEGPTCLLLYDAPGVPHAIMPWDGDTRVDDVTLLQSLTVTGRVIDHSGNPLGGLNVWGVGHFGVHGTWNDNLVQGISSALTDEDGHFALNGLDVGEQSLWIAGDHVIDTYAPVGDHAESHVDIGNITLSRGGQLTGRVLDIDERPLVNADVFIGESSAPNERPWFDHADVSHDLAVHHDVVSSPLGVTRTDEHGRFSIGGVSRQGIWVTSHVDGHAVAPQPIHLEACSAHIELVLPTARRTLLRIVDAANGAPLAFDEFKVEAEAIIAIGHDGEIRDSASELSVTRHARGVVIEHRGDVGADINVHAPHFVDTSAVILPGVAERTIALERGGTVRGTVTLNGQLDRATVIADERYGPGWQKINADELGAFELRGLRAGAWSLTATSRTSRHAASVLVDVEDDESIDSLEVQLQPLGRLEITIEGGKHAAIGLSSDLTGDTRWTSTHDDAVTFDDLTDGVWTIQAPGYRSVEAHVASPTTARATLTRLPAPRIVGRVRSAGKLVTHGQVFATRASRETVTDIADDGTFDLALDLVSGREGEFRLGWNVGHGRAVAAMEPVRLRWGDVVSHDLEIGDRFVDVRVVDADTGAGLPDVRLGTRTALGATWPAGFTNAEGRLRIGPIEDNIVAIATHQALAEPTEAFIDNDGNVLLRTRATGAIVVNPVNSLGESFASYVHVRLENVKDGRTISRVLKRKTSIDEVSVGTWRAVVSPAWVDIESIPLGIGEIVEIHRGEYTAVTIPLID